MKQLLNSSRFRNSMIGLSILTSQAIAQPLIPVHSLALTMPEQQALRAALPHDTETMTTLVWQGDPLSLQLPLHQERRLVFPEPVQVDVNGQITAAQLHIINDHQSVYLTALTALENKIRIYITLKNSGRIIFIDLTTTNQANSSTSAQVIQISVPAHLNAAISTDSVNHNFPVTANAPNWSESQVFSTSADEWVQAIRFAWQQLYAPAYLLSDQHDFIRSPLHSSFWLSGLFFSDSVFTHPLASWTKDNLVITAVELRNPSPHLTTLDLPHDLCGDWRAAVIYPRTVLQPVGNQSGDSATLFLISSESFHQALGGCDHGRA